MESEFNIKLILKALKKNIIWIILITFVCTALAGAVAIVTPPTYASTAKYLSTNYMSKNEYTQSALVNAQQELVNDYIEIIISKEMLEPVSASLKEKGLDYSYTELAQMIEGSQIKDTSAFTVKISCKNPDHALIIAQTLSKLVITVIDGVQKRENSVAVLDEGSAPVKTEPSLVKNVAIGFVLGFVASTVAFGLIAFYDRTIRTEEDLKNRFNLPIIGVVPEWKP